MRILISLHYSGIYGANLSIFETAKCLRDQFNVEIDFTIPANGKIEEKLKEHKFRYTVIPYVGSVHSRSLKSKIGSIRRLTKNLRQAIIWRKSILQANYDIVYVNSLTNQFGMLLATIAGKPFLVHLREYGRDDYGFEYDFHKTILQLLLSRAFAIISISKDLLRNHNKSYKTPDRQIQEVVYNGISSLAEIKKNKEALARTIPPFDKKIKLGVVGLITPNKGQEVAIRASALLKKNKVAHLITLYGDGDDREVSRLTTLIKELNVQDTVNFGGFKENPEEIYQDIDVLLMCSKREAMGRVTAEAMCKGKIVIGHASGATAEIIKANKTGLLYSGFDNANAVATLVQKTKSTPELHRDIIISALDFAAENFTVEMNAARIHKIINSH